MDLDLAKLISLLKCSVAENIPISAWRELSSSMTLRMVLCITLPNLALAAMCTLDGGPKHALHPIPVGGPSSHPEVENDEAPADLQIFHWLLTHFRHMIQP